MKKHLLLSLLLAAGAASAQQPATAGDYLQQAAAINDLQVSKPTKALQIDRVVKSQRLSSKAVINTLRTVDGALIKRLVVAGDKPSTLNPKATKAPARMPEGTALFESFEDYTGAEGWMPEGWNADYSLDDTYNEELIMGPIGWGIANSASMMGFFPDAVGTYYALCNFQIFHVDASLTSPVVEVPEDAILKFYAYVDPAFLFVLDDTTVDWDTFSFIGERKVSANLLVRVREEGSEEWTVVKDFASEYMGEEYGLMDLINLSPTELEETTVSLADFSGKRVEIDFQYVGAGGNTMIVDEIMVGNPQLEVSFMYPFSTLYYGFGKTTLGTTEDEPYNLVSLNLGIGFEPVFAPLTWTNTTEVDGADFTWLYHNPEIDDYDFANTTDLEVTYKPDYKSAFTRRNNLYYAPTLTGTARGFSAGTSTRYDYFQAGGTGEWEVTIGGQKQVIKMGLGVFDRNTDGLTYMMGRNTDGSLVPLYGYAEGSDQFWTDYTFQGDNGEGDGVKLTGIINYFFSPDAPSQLVINGMSLIGEGEFAPEAQLTFDVIALTEEGEMGDILASATVTGEECLQIGTLLYIEAQLEQPLTVSTDICDAFVVRFSGFNDPENCQNFTPYMSQTDSEGLCRGWLEKEITMEGQTRTSLTPTANYTGLNSFAIYLEAAYPWLTADADEVEIATGASAEIALGSYYDAEQLTVDAPEWLDVEKAGRYNEAKLTLTPNDAAAHTGMLTITAPGVEKNIMVTAGSSAIGSVEAAEAAEVEAVFTVNGQRVAAGAELPAGIYIVRRTDGTVSKVTVK